MCFKTLKRVPESIYVALLAMLAGCSGLVNEPQNGLRFVSAPPALTYFSPDSMPALTGTAAPLAKTLVKIDPLKIVVMTIRTRVVHPANPDQNYAVNFWNAHNNRRNVGENQVAFYTNSPWEEVIYTGELTRDGNYAKGTVGIGDGWNSVYIGFVMPGDTLGKLGAATYYLNEPGFADGWYVFSAAGGEKQVDTIPADSLQNLR
jgi:hypothetical protein